MSGPAGCRSSNCLNLGRDLNNVTDRKFRKEVNQFRNTFHQRSQPVLSSQDACSALTQAETVLEQAFESPAYSVSHKPCVLLEVYANPHSPITEYLQAQGYRAIRFTKADGDLSTVEGKAKLWKVIDEHQPLHIWVAPECGPWGGWNHLNMHKSVQLFDQICKKRREQLTHISLCSQLCRFQVERKRHFHLEQPLGSSMISTSQFQPICSLTNRTVVDMCVFGLKVPQTTRFLKKASQIFSTDPDLSRSFQGKRCPNQHEHQAIEGTILTSGKRVSLTHFCATYCQGFARHVAQYCVRPYTSDALVGESKRMRFTNPENKRFRLGPSNAFARRVAVGRSDSEPREVSRRVRQPNVDSAEPSVSRDSNPSRSDPPSSERWRDVFRMADGLAPRVGNHRLTLSDALTQQVQALISDLQIECIFISRGTQRFQVPLNIPEPRLNTHRFTVCMHRHTLEIHEFGSENWISLKRAQRIRQCMPCKLMITAFGHPRIISNPEIPQSEPRDPWDQLVHDLQVPDPRSQHVPQGEHEPSNSLAVPRCLQNPQICEGWAPPPVALHGPKFRALTSTEKQDLARLHNNLGHPDPTVLSEHLKAQNSPEHIVEAALEYACDACAESVSRKTRRPARLHEPKEFNDQVGLDGIFWTGIRGFQVQILHCIDEASLFHLARRIQTRNPDEAIVTWNEMWTSWAGNPKKVYSDPAGEFVSHPWKAMLQSKNIEQVICTEAWQRGRVERHGYVLKQMLSRYDQDQPIENIQEFDQVLLACCQAKNALTRQQGYSPEQIVLGKSIALPASLSSDDNAAAHSLAIGNDLESETFRRQLDIRTQARKAFLIADNDHSIRRALLHRSCPSRGKLDIGQMVMYWQKRNRASRHECGRWHGPAKVVSFDGQSSVWIAHADRLFKCALESLRPASLREWQFHGGLSHAVQESSGLGERRPQPLEPIPEQSVVQEYSPTMAPGTPPRNLETPLVTPHSSHQPESEAIPEEPSHEIPFAELPPSGVATPIDLDPPSETDDVPREVVLHCEECFVQSDTETLFDWTVLHPGFHSTESVVLAEDGLPYLSDPLTCDEQHCFSLEIELNDHDINKWAQSLKPEEFAWVSQVSKRARTEVNLKQLSLEDRILFEKAKDAELSCWIQTSALKPILRRSLNPEQILRSRWVCTWKPIDDAPAGGPQRKAKARLVVLGFQDPKLTEVVRDAPTLTREGRHTVLQTIASQQWTLSSFDIKTAFLRGHADVNNPLAMEPPPELRKKLSLSDNQVCSLVGNAYGRVDAPLLFYKELTSQLKKLGFEVHPLEPCVFLLVSGSDNTRVLHGIIGTHVDDGICGGDSFFHEQLNRLKTVLPFGSFKQQRFTFTGIALEQLPDFSILASQEEYVRQIAAIEIGRTRRQETESSITESELTRLRGVIGSLQYAVSNTRPDMAAKLGEIQVQVAKGTIRTLTLANKVLREAQETSHIKLCFRHIPVNQVTHVSFGDASFAGPNQLASFQGTLICATTPALDKNQRAPISPLTWASKKIARVVRSTLSAEAYAMSNSVDRLGWMRLLWGTVSIASFDWRQPHVGFRQLPIATIVTDCKSLYDLVSRTAMPSCEEYRTTLEVLLIRERCQEHCHFRWIPTSLQVADALTKPMDPALLRQVLSTGNFQLHDENDSLERNAHRKQAISWLRDSTDRESHQ